MTPLVLPSDSTSASFIVYASLGYAHSTIATETGDLVSCGFNRFGQQVCNPSVQTLPPFSSDQEATSGGSSGTFPVESSCFLLFCWWKHFQLICSLQLEAMLNVQPQLLNSANYMPLLQSENFQNTHNKDVCLLRSRVFVRNA
jgi:hypothetical protein